MSVEKYGMPAPAPKITTGVPRRSRSSRRKRSCRKPLTERPGSYLEASSDLGARGWRTFRQPAQKWQERPDEEAFRYIEFFADAAPRAVETFRLLRRDLGYSPSGAWHTALRVHASGGFTRDLIYLRGLIELLALLRDGADLRSLYIGKIAQKHIPIMEELRHRQLLREPPLTPRYLNEPEAADRLEAVRRGLPLTELICPDPR